MAGALRAKLAWHDFAMSLATRCTSCGTAFRVVQDQLKISEGWVRCGQCNAVFNALEGLFDLGRERTPAGRRAPAARRRHRLSGAAPTPSATGRDRRTRAAIDAPPAATTTLERRQVPTSNFGELLADPIDAHLFGPRKRAESAPKPAGQIVERDRVEFSDARFDSDLFAENAAVAEDETLMLPATDAGDAGARERGAAGVRAPRRAAGDVAQHRHAQRARRGVARWRRSCSCCRSPTTAATRWLPNTRRCARRSSRGAASPAARCRRRAASTTCSSRAPR